MSVWSASRTCSPGPSFPQNEKRKDKDLTERIARILKLRDEVVKGVDLSTSSMMHTTRH